MEGQGKKRRKRTFERSKESNKKNLDRKLFKNTRNIRNMKWRKKD